MRSRSSTAASSFQGAEDRFQYQLELQLYTEAQAHRCLYICSLVAELLWALLERAEPDHEPRRFRRLSGTYPTARRLAVGCYPTPGFGLGDTEECCVDHEEAYVRCRFAGRVWESVDLYCATREAYNKQTLCLLKVEWCGDGSVGLCSKTYYCFGTTDKYSTKGLSKRQNAINKDAFLDVLTRRRNGRGWNRRFHVKDSSVLTCVQERAASRTSSQNAEYWMMASASLLCKELDKRTISVYILYILLLTANDVKH